MWFNLLFLTVIFWNCGLLSAQSFPVNTVKVYNYARMNDTSRLFYTNLTEVSVFEDYDPADFPSVKDLGMYMMAESPKNCTCPDLVAIHSVTIPSGQLRFERADKMTSDMKDHGLAGYLAPLPGYCGSDGIELIEFYSPVLKAFRYDSSNNIYNYYVDYKYFFRPVRVLGYAYYTTPSVWLSGNPPYFKHGVTSPLYQAISVKFDMVHMLVKDNKTSFVASPQLIKKLVETQGWSLSSTQATSSNEAKIRPGPVSLQNDLDKIREICGVDALQRCRDTYNPETGTYRMLNLDETGAGGREEVADCGYFIKDTVTCFPQAARFYSYSIPDEYYFNYEFTHGYNAVGKASPYIFSFLQ